MYKYVSENKKEPFAWIQANPEKGATTIKWKDGTMTIVRTQNEEYDFEKGIAMAHMKKMYGNNGMYNEVFREVAKTEVNEKTEETRECASFKMVCNGDFYASLRPIGHRWFILE